MRYSRLARSVKRDSGIGPVNWFTDKSRNVRFTQLGMKSANPLVNEL